MNQLEHLLKDLREHRVDHGRQTSKTVQAWADRLESAMEDHLALCQKVSSDRELLAKIDEYLELKGVGKSAVIRHLIRNALVGATKHG